LRSADGDQQHPASGDLRSDLTGALARLAELTPDPLHHHVAELQRRLAEDRFRVLVIGEAKRGKSTLINALLDEPVLPMGVTPLTSIATTVTYGHPRRVEVTLADGSRVNQPLDALPELVTEVGNPGNHRRLAAVTVYLDAPLLAEGIELVDTPGTGSVHARNTAEAEAALEAMDAAVFVLTGDPPISAHERELLTRIAPSSAAIFVVLNKADRHAPGELTEVAAFTEEVVRSAAGHDIMIHLCSALQALTTGPASSQEGAQPAASPAVLGIDEFRATFLNYLRTNRAADLLTSLHRQADELANQLLDDVRLTLRAAALRGREAAHRVDLFRTEVDKLQRRHLDARDVVHGETTRLLDAINIAAESAAVGLTAEMLQRLDRWLGTQDPDTTVGTLERQGLTFADETIKASVENWRATHALQLQQDLETLDARLRDDLQRATDDLRQAAADLLDIELHITPAITNLAASPRFHYVPPGAAWRTPGVVRGHLPGVLGRRRTIQRLHDQVRALVPKHVGRARADLQQRLQETTRQFLAMLSRQYDNHAARLHAALDAAAQLNGLAAADSAALRRQLDARRASLEALAQELSLRAPRSRSGH